MFGCRNCMAANSKTSTKGIANLGKRVVNQIWTANSSHRSPTSFSHRRAAHSSVYDKNVEEHVCPSIVPDDVIQQQSDKYWAPHPRTGVFGPATDQNATAGSSSAVSNSGQSSVLEEKAWFRPTSLEDLEKPNHH